MLLTSRQLQQKVWMLLLLLLQLEVLLLLLSHVLLLLLLLVWLQAGMALQVATWTAQSSAGVST
jgi:hypothetical protein